MAEGGGEEEKIKSLKDKISKLRESQSDPEKDPWTLFGKSAQDVKGDENIEKKEIINVHEDFVEKSLADFAKEEVPSEEELKEEYKNRKSSKGSKSSEGYPEASTELGGHERVTFALPPLGSIPMRDLIGETALTNLFPPTNYSIAVKGKTNADCVVSLIFAEESREELEKRVRFYDGLVAVKYFTSKLLGEGGYGKVYMASGGFYHPESKAVHMKRVVVKEVLIKTIQSRKYAGASPPAPAHPFVENVISGPIDFMVGCMMRHPHLCRNYDYTIMTVKTPADPPGRVMSRWFGVLELLESGDFVDYIENWQWLRALHGVVKTPMTHRQQAREVDKLWDQIHGIAKYGCIPELMVRTIMFQLYNGLLYMHRQGFSHMDIKPENVMADKHGTWKFVDFGLCIPFRTELKQEKWTVNCCGTPGYMAGEVIACFGAPIIEERSAFEASRADLFAMGVLGFELVYGDQPFPFARDKYQKPDWERSLKFIYMGTKTGQPYWFKNIVLPHMSTFEASGAFIEHMFKCTAWNPKDRPTCEELLSGRSGVNWVVPARGSDALWDFTVLHGSIVPVN